MKKTFPEYNPLSKDAIKELWDGAIFIFDTNVLLNLYRYSDETSEKFLETIVELKERIWLPHQVGFEFNKNRLSVISDQKKHYVEFEKKINELILEVENKNRNPFLSSPLFKKLNSVKSDIKVEIDSKIDSYEKKFLTDSLLEKINSVFEDKVGNILNDDELKKIYIDGKTRYNEKVPPGYCDIKKPENERYGDLIIWKQIISKSKGSKIDIIFILDDGKEDWWLEQDGMTISPRPELLKEFRNDTNQRCHFYKPFQFLNYSKEHLGTTIKKEVIEEVKNYKPDIILKDKFIQINLSLKGRVEDIIILSQEMKDAGYNIFPTYSDATDLHELVILLPNIPDLERRFTSKYILNLMNYNIKLVEKTKK